MKKIILSITVAFFLSVSFAQEAEVNAALKALEANNINAAKSELIKVESSINKNTTSPETLAGYYFTKGKIALKEGNTSEAASALSKLKSYEIGTMYSAKNKDTKEVEFFTTESDGNAALANGNYAKLKEIPLTLNFLPKVEEELRTIAGKLVQEANTAYESKNYALAGNNFIEVQSIVNALGVTDNIYKYNAALSYHLAEDFNKAIEIYKELINSGYTGEKSTIVATEVETGKKVSFNSMEDAKLQQSLKLVKDIKTETTPSVEKDLYTQAMRCLYELKKADPIMDKISAKYPNDEIINTLIGNLYAQTGDTSKLEAAIKNDPNNAINYYNLASLYMNMEGKDEAAVENLKKAIALKPDLKNAYINLALVLIKPEKNYIEKINANLGTSSKEKSIYKEFTKKRKDLYLTIIPYLEKLYELDKTDLESVSMLRKAYQAAEMFNKEDELKAVERELKKQ